MTDYEERSQRMATLGQRRVALWKARTADEGDRRMGVYLRWLAAQWELFSETHLAGEEFDEWLHARFNS